MSLTVGYTALALGVLVWFVLARRLTAKSWETNGVAARDALDVRWPAAKVGLAVFLAVVTSLFGLFIAAYYMRMGFGHGADAALNDWRAVSESPLLWINSVVLVCASVAMQSARAATQRTDVLGTRRALLLSGGLTVAFLIGQLLAWRQLRASAVFDARNPAVAFFYLLTAVHGLHLLGGLYVWGRTFLRLRLRRAEIIDVRLSVELCAVYWHFLLLVWIVLFGLLLAT